METTINIADWTQFWIQQSLVLTGVVFAGLAGYFAYKVWKSTQFNNLIYVNDFIFNSRKKFLEISKLKYDANDNSNNNSFLDASFRFVNEDLLMSYDLLCALYLKKEIDQNIFDTQRKNEIIWLFEKNNKNEYKIPLVVKYKHVCMVYDKFKNENIQN